MQSIFPAARASRIGKEFPLPHILCMIGRALVLIGFMGSGKSSVGRIVAERLGLPRFDTDEMVSAQMRLPIAEIFARSGEAAFRESESSALTALAGDAPAVIVTGGGMVLRPENAEHCRTLGTIACLTADEETVFRRVSRRPSRPLLKTDNPRATLSELFQERRPLYHALADFEIDTTSLSHAEVADILISRWNPAASMSRQSAP